MKTVTATGTWWWRTACDKHTLCMCFCWLYYVNWRILNFICRL